MPTGCPLFNFWIKAWNYIIYPMNVSTMYLLTEWEGRTGKYLAQGHGTWIEDSKVHGVP